MGLQELSHNKGFRFGQYAGIGRKFGTWIAASNSEDRLEVATMFSVISRGSRFFSVDSDANAKTSLLLRDSRGGGWVGGGRIMLVHSTLTQYIQLYLQIRNRILLWIMFPHLIHLLFAHFI